MATEKIDSIFDLEAINREVKDVKEKIGSVLSGIEKFAQNVSNAIGDINKSSTFSEMSAVINKVNEAQKNYGKQVDELNKLSAQEVSLKAKQSQLYQEEYARIEKIRQEVAEQTKTIRDQVKSQREIEKANKQTTQSIDDQVAAAKRSKNSINELNAETSKLRKIVKSLDINSEKEQIDKINAIINENTQIIKDNSDAQLKDKLSVGGYAEGIKQAASETGIFNEISSKLSFITKGISSGFASVKNQLSSVINGYKEGANNANGLSGASKSAAVATNLLSTAMKLLKVALISTGIGALVVALGSLVAYLTKTQQGSEQLSKVMSQIGAVVDVVIDRLAALGGALVRLFSGDFKGAWEETKKAFEGIGDEMEREYKLAGELKDISNQLEKQEVMLNIQRDASRAKIEQLKLLGDDVTKTIGDRIQALKQSTDIENELLQKQIDMGKQQLANMLGQKEVTKEVEHLMQQLSAGAISADEVIGQLGLSNSTLDDLREFATKFKEVKDLEQQSYTRQKEVQNKTNTLIKEQIKQTQNLTIYTIQSEINRQKAIVDNEKNSYEFRVNSLDEYYHKSRILLDQQYQYDMSQDGLSFKQKELITKKHNDSLLKLKEEYNKESEKLEINETGKRLAAIYRDTENERNKQYQNELSVLSKQYSKTNMTTEDYEKQRMSIIRKYQTQSFNDEIDYLQSIVEQSGLRGNDLLEAQKTLSDKRIEFNKFANEQQIADDEKAGKERIKAKEEQNKKELEKEKALQAARKQLISEAYSAMFDITNSIFERRIQGLDKEIEKINEQKEAELAATEEMDLSEEERQARKDAIEKKAEQQQAQLEKKKKQEQRKQAIMDKAAALIQVIINTAIGISKAVAQFPMTGGMPFAAIVAAMGAIQAATIAAQPIPQYAKGTEDHPGGFAIVGDAGRREVVVTPEGDYYTTPAVPTLIDIPKHSQVLPDFSKAVESMTDIPSFKSDLGELKSFDYIRLEKKFDELASQISSSIEQSQSSLNINLDPDGTWSVYDKKKGRTKYINDRLNFRKN